MIHHGYMSRMYKQHLTDGGITEFSEDACNRLRGKMAERRLRQADVMMATGWSRTTCYRKLQGRQPLDTDDLAMLWRVLGISPWFLMTGDQDDTPFPDPDGEFADQDGDQVSERSSVQTRQGAPRHLRLVAES